MCEINQLPDFVPLNLTTRKHACAANGSYFFMNSTINYGFIIYFIYAQNFNKTKPIKIFKILFLLSELDMSQLNELKLIDIFTLVLGA